MPRRAGMASEMVGAPMRSDVVSHLFRGARDLPTVAGALELQLDVKRAGDRVSAIAEVANVGAGHSIPGGGGALRRLELRVRARSVDGAEIFTDRREYQLRYFAADGHAVGATDPEAVRFVDAAIRAGERRRESFAFPAGAAPASVRAELWLWYVVPDVQERSEVRLDESIAGPVRVLERVVDLQH